MSATGMHS